MIGWWPGAGSERWLLNGLTEEITGFIWLKKPERARSAQYKALPRGGAMFHLCSC